MIRSLTISIFNIRLWQMQLWLLVFAFQFQTGFSQPVLVASKTDVVCSGSGVLFFELQNAVAPVTYHIYLLPDTTTPYETLLIETLGGLNPGTYLIKAIQAGDPTEYTAQLTLLDLRTPLLFSVAHVPENCVNDAAITVTVTNGNPVSYSLSGAQVRPAQPSNIFTNLPAGFYNVKVTDECGATATLDHTVIHVDTELIIGPTEYTEESRSSCELVGIQHSVLVGGANQSIHYPVTVTYTVHPPNGGPDIILTQQINSGPAHNMTLNQNLPYYDGIPYSYDVRIETSCDGVFELNNNVVDRRLTFSLVPGSAFCGEYYLIIEPYFYMPPYEITFVSAPAGFDPEALNPAHPGPFTSSDVHYGSATQTVPFGMYVIRVEDACGASFEMPFELLEIEIEPQPNAFPDMSCTPLFGTIEITVPGAEIDTIHITDAPEGYPEALPQDVTMFAEGPEFSMGGLIGGWYTFEILDTCGNVHIVEVELEMTPSAGSANIRTRGDCEPGHGGLYITGVSAAEIVSAPETFTGSLPWNLSDYFYDNILTVAGLPAGNYRLELTNLCGNSLVRNVAIPAYEVLQNDVEIIRQCGTFNIALSHSALNAVTFESFFLQQKDPATGLWKHPVTGVLQNPGDLPTTANAISVQNNFTNLNYSFEGDFRVVKTFEAFENGTAGTFKICEITLHEFHFTDAVAIDNIFKTSCGGEFTNVRVIAQGIEPLIYKIEEKNGLPFLVDNGTNSLFENLEPGLYKFTVSHSCGDTDIRYADVTELPPPAVAYPLENLFACDIGNDGSEVFDLSLQNAPLLGPQNAGLYTITYHATQTQAQTGTQPIGHSYSGPSTTLYARLTFNESPECFGVTGFEISVRTLPDEGIEPRYGLCNDAPVTVSAASGFDAYLWSTGQTSPSVVIGTPGDYWLEVVKNFPEGPCVQRYDFVVEPVPIPQITAVSPDDWTDDRNSISVKMSDDGPYLYSIDGIHFQESNHFGNLLPGAYTIYVRDLYGCYQDSIDTYLLNYPRFFTPNGDGINDYWQVKHAPLEPGLYTYIFDRYGKLITGFDALSPGWDGRYNGHALPSTDYWFLVIRANGQELRGHFAMKR